MRNLESLKYIHCNKCNRETKHNILTTHTQHTEILQVGVEYWHDYHIIACGGCESISFISTYAFSEDFNPYTRELDISITAIYPNRAERIPIDGHEHFPAKTRKIYLEVLNAMNCGSPLLSAMGLRALIESICIEQQTKEKTLEKKIGELSTLGLLSNNQADILHNHRFLGNIAAHEIEAPDPEELLAALEIAETLLKTIYILPWLDAKIKTRKKTT